VNQALIVTLHDVSPRNLPVCRTAVAAMEAEGLTRLGLLVIPADPEGPLQPEGETADWLRAQVGRGHEVIQHGYYHRRWPAEPLRLPQAFANAMLARGVAEFVALDRASATCRLQAGRSCLQAAGLDARGFIAPAWLHSAATRRAVRETGFRYFASQVALYDIVRDRTFRSMSLCNRPGSPFGDWSARRVNELLLACQSGKPLLRVAVHPADLGRGEPFLHTLRLLSALLEAGRQPLTYGQYLELVS
jgi:predicted deacetylase